MTLQKSEAGMETSNVNLVSYVTQLEVDNDPWRRRLRFLQDHSCQ